MSAPSSLPNRLTTNFYALLSLPATAMGFALSVQISALSWILSTKYELNLEEIGYVWMAGPLAGIFGQLIAGYISDGIWFWGGRRRPLIIIGGIFAAAAMLMLPYLDIISTTLGLEDIVIVALIVALVLDLAINIGFNPTRSIIADVTPEGDARTRGYTMMQTISGAFGVAAYLIGATEGNYVLIYVGVVVTLLFTLIPPLFIKEPRILGAHPEADHNAAEVLDVAKDQLEEGELEPKGRKANLSQLIPIYIAHAFTWIGVQTMFVFLFAYVRQAMEITDDKELGAVPGISFAVMNTVGFVLPALVLEPLAKRFGRVRVHTVCIAVMALAYFSVLLAGDSKLGVYILMAFIGVGWAATVSLPFAIMSEYVDQSRMGLWMGIFNLSVVLPQLFVSGVLGKQFENAGDKSVILWVCASSLAVSALLWAVLVRDKHTTSTTQA